MPSDEARVFARPTVVARCRDWNNPAEASVLAAVLRCQAAEAQGDLPVFAAPESAAGSADATVPERFAAWSSALHAAAPLWEEAPVLFARVEG